MKKLSAELKKVSSRLNGKDDSSRLARRVAEVHALWKDAVEQLYKGNTPYVLKHTNGVCIKKENGLTYLTVYMDDGGVRSDVHCQQHFILTWIEQVHGEKIDVFKTLPARFDMRNRHPYLEGMESSGDSCASGAKGRKSQETLSPQEEKKVLDTASSIEDPRLRHALEKAMSADLTWKKQESEEKQ